MSPLNTPPITPLEQQQIRATGREGETFWHRVRFQFVGRVVSQLGAHDVLDVGAGSGLLGDWLTQHVPSCSYHFEETSPVLDAALARRFGTDQRSPGGAPIDATTLVTLLDVVEHVQDDAALLRSLYERMATGTHLVVTVPALKWAFTSWDTNLGHYRRYSRRDVRRLVTHAGFSTVSCSYIFPELLPLLVARKFRRAPRAHVDFPQLPTAIDRTGELISRATTALRTCWPAGTSVVAVLTKTAP